MSPERNGYEHEPKPGEQAFENLVDHLDRVGHKVNRENLEALINKVRVEDLSNSPLKERIGEVPLATVSGRELVLDKRFERFSPEQQLHVLAHEYGHTLSWFMAEQEDNERFQSVAKMISLLPGNQVSYYVDHLEHSLPEDESRQVFLENERIAEVFAQYLESDRTFSGFMMAKLLEFPHGDTDLSDSEREQYTKMAEQVGEFGDYLEMADSDENHEAFLAYHSELAPHYQLWQELNTLFDETDFSQIGETATQDDYSDYEAWEMMELASELHAEAPRANPEGTPKTALGAVSGQQEEKPRTFFGDLITFWKVFA